MADRTIVVMDRALQARRLAAIQDAPHLARLVYWSAWTMLAHTAKGDLLGCVVGDDRSPVTESAWQAAAGIRKVGDFRRGLESLEVAGLIERHIVGSREHFRLCGYTHERRTCVSEILGDSSIPVRQFVDSSIPVEAAQGLTAVEPVAESSETGSLPCDQIGDNSSNPVDKSPDSVDNSDSRKIVNESCGSRSGLGPIYKDVEGAKRTDESTNGRIESSNVNVNVTTTRPSPASLARGPSAGAAGRAADVGAEATGPTNNETIVVALETLAKSVPPGDKQRQLNDLVNLARSGQFIHGPKSLLIMANDLVQGNETTSDAGATVSSPARPAAPAEGPRASEAGECTAFVKGIIDLTGDHGSRRNWELLVKHYLRAGLKSELVPILQRFREDVQAKGRDNLGGRPGAILNGLLRNRAKELGVPVPLKAAAKRGAA